MLDRLDLPQGTLDLLILRTLAQRHPGKSVGRTYSSILQDNGEDVKVVQELLRHSSSKMTLDVYAQALTPTKRAAQREVVAMIREDLAHLYFVSYYPQPNPNRGWRAITVKLKDPKLKKYKLRTRSGYRPVPAHVTVDAAAPAQELVAPAQ